MTDQQEPMTPEEAAIARESLLVTIEQLLGNMFGQQAIQVVDFDHSQCPENHIHEHPIKPVFNNETMQILSIAGHLVKRLVESTALMAEEQAVSDFWDRLHNARGDHAHDMLEVAAAAARKSAVTRAVFKAARDATNPN